MSVSRKSSHVATVSELLRCGQETGQSDVSRPEHSSVPGIQPAHCTCGQKEKQHEQTIKKLMQHQKRMHMRYRALYQDLYAMQRHMMNLLASTEALISSETGQTTDLLSVKDCVVCSN